MVGHHLECLEVFELPERRAPRTLGFEVVVRNVERDRVAAVPIRPHTEQVPLSAVPDLRGRERGIRVTARTIGREETPPYLNSGSIVQGVGRPRIASREYVSAPSLSCTSSSNEAPVASKPTPCVSSAGSPSASTSHAPCSSMRSSSNPPGTTETDSVSRSSSHINRVPMGTSTLRTSVPMGVSAASVATSLTRATSYVANSTDATRMEASSDFASCAQLAAPDAAITATATSAERRRRHPTRASSPNTAIHVGAPRTRGRATAAVVGARILRNLQRRSLHFERGEVAGRARRIAVRCDRFQKYTPSGAPHRQSNA